MMKPLMALALLLMSLLLSTVLTACEEADGDYYENDKHSGYPGPGTKTPNSY
jgi:hypothetical protein